MADHDAIWARYVARNGSNGSIPPEQTVAVEAITGFLRHQAADLDAATAREQATIEAAWKFASAWRAVESDSAYPAGTVPGIPAIRGMRIAEAAIDQFLDHQRAGQTPLAAYLVAVEQANAAHTSHEPRPQPVAVHQPGSTWEAELEAADALADAPDWVRNGWPDPTDQEPNIGP